jgi:hypothetical protein
LVAGAIALAATGSAECDGDECQGPPPAPAEIVPGTAVVEGPQNPPVRFPKAHGRKHHPKKQHQPSQQRRERR